MLAFVLVLVFAGTAFLIVAIYAFLNRRRLAATAALRQRAEGGFEASSFIVFRDTRASAVPILDRMLTARSLAPALARVLQRAGTRFTAGEFVLASALCAALGVAFAQRFGYLVALLAGAAGLFLPALVVRVMTKRRQRKFEEQLPEAIDMIVNAMRAGFSFQAAMRFVGEEIPKPLGEEFMRFYDEQRLGVDVRTALLALQHRMDTIDVRMFVTSLLIQRETGGNLGEVLGGLATLIRSRDALRGQVETLTAEPKMTGRALSVLPFLAFILMWSVNRAQFRLMVDTQLGQRLLIYAGVSMLLGAIVLHKMADIEA